jgi:hypothetical protein
LGAGAFASAGSGVDFGCSGGAGGGGGGVAWESAGFSGSAVAGASAGLALSTVGCDSGDGGVESGLLSDFAASSDSAGFSFSASLVSGEGVGVALAGVFFFEVVFVADPFPDPEVDFLFAEDAGFLADSDFDLVVAAYPLASITNGSSARPMIFRMFETLNIGGRK